MLFIVFIRTTIQTALALLGQLYLIFERMSQLIWQPFPLAMSMADKQTTF